MKNEKCKANEKSSEAQNAKNCSAKAVKSAKKSK